MARVPGQQKPTLESKLETLLFELVMDELHALPIKLMPTRTGLPDRLVCLRGGVPIFIELKQDGKKPEPIQLHQHDRLRRLGYRVVVLAGEDEIRNWVALQLEVDQLT